MRRTLLNISEKIDPLTIAIYEQIASVAESQKINFFIVGATARDLIFEHGFGIKSGRATRDVDLAVQVTNWDEFETLKNSLIKTGQFSETRMTQRLQYQETIPVDIVPFGAITGADGSITWPPDFDIRMSVIGFDDAFRDAIPVRLREEPQLNVLVASPTSLAVLKLISWKERAPENTRDAIDLNFIIRCYLDIGNHERLQEEHRDLVDEDFDYIRAGARLLGRDISRVLGEESIGVLQQILEEQTNEADRYPLVEDMSRGATAEEYEENLALLNFLKQGLLEKGYE
jgi:predicted nucleotidyltransferase